MKDYGRFLSSPVWYLDKYTQMINIHHSNTDCYSLLNDKTKHETRLRAATQCRHQLK